MMKNEQRKVILTPEKALTWLDFAKWAPSGGNAQPWRVEYEENYNSIAFRLAIEPVYKTNSSLMDVRGAASAMALGALAENLKLIAVQDSFKLSHLSTDNSNKIWDGTVNLLFEKQTNPISIVEENHLNIEALTGRYTHRGVFNQTKLPMDFTQKLETIFKNFKTLKYHSFEPESEPLYRSLSLLEKIRWQHQPYLESLLAEVSFQDKHSFDKIPSTQLGVSFLDQQLLKFLKKFPDLGTLIMKSGMAHIPVIKSTRRFVNNCQKVIFIQTDDVSFSNCFDLGRCFQKIWMSCAAANIAFQPNGNTLIALGYWLTPETISLPVAYVNRVKEATDIFKKQFDLDLKKPVMGFRIGFSDERMDRSPRKNIEGIQRYDLIRKLQKELL